MAYQRRLLLRQQDGVGMFEVLVTVVVLAIGLLGVASLQFLATQTNLQGLNRTQAVLAAQQMSARLSANAATPSQAFGLAVDSSYFDHSIYNFDNLTCETNASNYNCHCLQHPPNIPDCRGGACDATQMAVFDAYELSCALARLSPNTRLGLVCADNNPADDHLCSAGSKFTVLLRWPVPKWQQTQPLQDSHCNIGQEDISACVGLGVVL